MFFLPIVVGGLLLAFGRKFFWLFVAACGFAVGLTVVHRALSGQPEWFALIVALAGAVLGALLAVFVHPLAVGVGGFLAGGFVAVAVAGRSGLDAPVFFALAFIAGGAIGALLIGTIFDWGLIALSSLSGSSLIVEALPLHGSLVWVVWMALVAVGVGMQFTIWRRERR